MKLEAREYMALAIVGMFGFLLAKNPTDAVVITTLQSAFMLAVGYYLGASKIGSDTAKTNAEAIAHAATTATSSEPQQVEVVNDERKPVPTVET